MSYPADVRFECQRCSRCCADTEARGRRILLLEAEARVIAEAKGIPLETFAVPSPCTPPYAFSMRKVEGRCVFLRRTECTVYAVRPLVCRFFPFELRRSEPEGYEFVGTEEYCPGLGRGRLLTHRLFKELFASAEELFSRL